MYLAFSFKNCTFIDEFQERKFPVFQVNFIICFLPGVINMYAARYMNKNNCLFLFFYYLAQTNRLVILLEFIIYVITS